MNTPAPIVLFVYNRPDHTEKTILSLQDNHPAKESDLFIFSDGAKGEKDKNKVAKVRTYIKSVTGFRNVIIIERSGNMGLANSIISGVTEIVNKYGNIIVLEDDLLPSPYFLTFMNDALKFYQNEEKVISIHGYIYPVTKKLPETFFLKGADCWGWATWKRGWDLFNPDGTALMKELKNKRLIKDFDFNNSYPYYKMLTNQTKGENDSWAVRWYASAFLNNKLTLYPNRSLIFYNGNDGSGTNSNDSDEFKVDLSCRPVVLEKIEVTENKEARKAFIHYFRYTRLTRKIMSRLKKLFHKK
ncbi:MAG: glycosyltransferase [Bacteroidales bacterium]|jgi:hypothetical protein|nr:glycosyltransferase [Bacteroidales bacterium]